MREILFRGKRADNGEWVEGYLYPAIGVDKGKWLITVVDSTLSTSNTYVVIPDTVGQYIGLDDKNDCKIFEGDVVRDDESGYEYVIKWFPEYACYSLADKRGNMVFDSDEIEMFLNDLIVVDNVHDNSDFTEVSK